MTSTTAIARTLRALLIPVAVLATGMGAAFAEELALPLSQNKAARVVEAHVLSGQTRLTVSAPERGDRNGPLANVPHTVLVALPRGTTRYSVDVLSPAGAHASLPDGLMSLRGQPVLRVLVHEAGNQEAEITVRHDGQWLSQDEARLASGGLKAAIAPTLPVQRQDGLDRGSYLMVIAPPFAAAMQPLIDWKTRQGHHVRTVSTSETGASTSGIQAYIQNAYDTWDIPPEYVLLVGDVDEIPTYSFHGNPSDQPYVQLDGDDWLMDALIGRFSVQNSTEAAVMVAKTINYERHPDLAGQDWQTRNIMVGANYGSDTPIYTVDFASQKLQELGFQPPSEVKVPPLPSIMGAQVLSNFLNQGTGIVVYRGWAYGSDGWDPPYFKIEDVGALQTNDMNPIVMSFVCLTGDYTASTPCFGEVFVRQGTPEAPGKGAVAFIGNGEHWSHTRHNDAIAISIFERITDPEIRDLGSLLNAGKMRFMDYFPGEMNADEQEDPEESVEFYFHIYNLLGDPSLNIWKGLPRAVDVSHDPHVAVGTSSLAVFVTDPDGGQGIAGARVGVCQDGTLLGTGVTDASGSVQVLLDTVAAGSDLDITVTGADATPYEGTISVGTADVFLAVSDLQFSAGDDGVLNPGETVAATATVTNHGTSSSGSFELEIMEVRGPATLSGQTVSMASLAGGESATAEGTITFTVAEDAADGELITLDLRALRDGEMGDFSSVTARVAAPAWEVVSLVDAQGEAPRTGATTDLVLTLRNNGSVDATAGQVTLVAPDLQGLSLGNSTSALDACAVGEMVSTAAVFDLMLSADLATGTNLNFGLDVTTGTGYRTDSSCATIIGPVDVSSPIGPDGYGYYAYDSADFDYPAKRPVYFWNEISTALGGPGTRLDFPVENEVVWMVVDLPFSFRYYGQDYTQIRVSDNGWVSFDTGTDYDFYNWAIPTQYGTEALVAPFWDNLTPVWIAEENPNGMEPDGIYVHHDEELGGFVVEWSRLPHYKPEVLGFQTFQLVLLDPAQHASNGGDGEMLFLYRQVQNNDDLRMYATVGIESPDGLDGLQLTYDNVNTAGMAPLQPGLAIRMTTDAPVRVPFTTTRFAAEAVAGRAQLSWECPQDRPVVGWHVDRVRENDRARLTEAALPAGSTAFQAPDHRDGDTYILCAMHPYGVTSEPGQTMAAGSPGTRLALYPAHPNPARGSASMAFSLPRETDVSLRVYDVAGRLVRTVFQGRAAAGEGLKVWDGRQDDGRPVAGGIYFYRLETGTEVLTRKLILVR